MNLQIVIGLETHVELNTATKLFCGCTTSFGGEPNSHCCPVCTGQPGSLPVLNRAAVEKAILAGLALGCRINPISRFERKHYHYPDLPRAYQITQWNEPLCRDGSIELSDGAVIAIENIHLEDDAGKLQHQDGSVYVDYNRCGVPLIEIVTAPALYSPAQAVEYLQALRDILRTCGVSDCKMQEGSLRCDVNVSVRTDRNGPLGTRTEIKNLNSFSAVDAAIRREAQRQTALLESGRSIERATLHYDAAADRIVKLRSKEQIADYRYMPEPDIPPLIVTEDQIRALRALLPELPAAKRARFTSEYALSPEETAQLTRYSAVADYFERAVKISDAPKTVAGLILTRLFAAVPTEAARQLWQVPVSADTLGKLAALMRAGEIRPNVGKTLLSDMMAPGTDPDELLEQAQKSRFDSTKLPEFCAGVIEANPKAVGDFLKGKEKSIKALVGGVMAATKGQADPAQAEMLLRQLLRK